MDHSPVAEDKHLPRLQAALPGIFSSVISKLQYLISRQQVLAINIWDGETFVQHVLESCVRSIVGPDLIRF